MGQKMEVARLAKEKKQRENSQSDKRRKRVGHYYDTLGRHLLHENSVPFGAWEVTNGEHAPFDLSFEDAIQRGFYVEFKGASNNDRIKILVEQLRKQRDELGFPVQRAIVMLFKYENRSHRDGGKQVRLLKRMAENSPGKTKAFLASHTKALYVIDFDFLEALAKRAGSWTNRFDKNRPRESAKVRFRELERSVWDTRNALEKLGFSDEEKNKWLRRGVNSIRPLRIKTVCDGHEVRAELFPILPRGFREKFIKSLNGSVQRHVSVFS